MTYRAAGHSTLQSKSSHLSARLEGDQPIELRKPSERCDPAHILANAVPCAYAQSLQTAASTAFVSRLPAWALPLWYKSFAWRGPHPSKLLAGVAHGCSRPYEEHSRASCRRHCGSQCDYVLWRSYGYHHDQTCWIFIDVKRKMVAKGSRGWDWVARQCQARQMRCGNPVSTCD